MAGPQGNHSGASGPPQFFVPPGRGSLEPHLAISLFIAVVSLGLVFVASMIGGEIVAETTLLVAVLGLFGVTAWALRYAQSGALVIGAAITAAVLVIFSQTVNILDETPLILDVPVLGDDDTRSFIKKFTVVLGLFFFIVALFLAVVESGAVRRRLNAERNFLSRVMQGTSTLITVVDPDGTISYLNHAVLALTGKSRDELLGKDWWDCFSAHPISDPQRKADFLAGKNMENIVLVLHAADGGKRYISWSSNNIYSEDGQLLESFRFGQDVTLRMAYEEERNRLATAIEQSRELVALTDAHGAVQYVNPAFLEVTGYNLEDVLGQPLHELGSGQYTPELLESMRATLGAGQVWHANIHHATPKGIELDLSVVASPLINPEGKLRGFAVSYRDVTHELELERELRHAQKMQAIGTLAGGVAHDFNNILSPIIGYTEMALHELPKDTRAHKYLLNIMDAGVRAKELVRQILVFSKQSEHDRKLIRLAPVFREALKLMRGSMPPSVEIEEDIDPTCPPVLADATQMHRVFVNLCTNAFHAMENRGGLLTITYKPERVTLSQAERTPGLKEGEYACLAVSDTGMGIEKHVRHRIFDPYYTTKAEGKGTGLGLATVHGIVQAHDGVISLQSEVGKGTSVLVYLPVFRGDAVSDAVTQSGTAGSQPVFPQGAGEKILLVDDEFSVLQVTRRMLTRFGYEVVAVSLPGEALELFTQSPHAFALVLTDLSMPGMTGISLARAIREARGDVPVVLITGFNSEQVREEAREAGIACVASKPLTAQELGDIVYRVLHARETPGAQPSPVAGP